jgi:hypothetical protein
MSSYEASDALLPAPANQPQTTSSSSVSAFRTAAVRLLNGRLLAAVRAHTAMAIFGISLWTSKKWLPHFWHRID